MGCTESLFKKKPKDGDQSTDAALETKKGDVKKTKEKKEKSKPVKEDKKDKKKSKKESKSEADNVITSDVKNGKGPNSAKVRPMTPTPPVIPNIPKPVAFDVDLDEGQKSDEVAPDGSAAAQTTESNGGRGRFARFPRKLPKLSSLARGNSTTNSTGSDDPKGAAQAITSEDIAEKQRKAEEKRQEILEEKKQKARNFVKKFGNGGSNSGGDSGEGEGEEGPGLRRTNALDSGLGLDGYGLEDAKPEEEEHGGNQRIETEAPVVVQAD